MSDLADTPNVAVSYCPRCDPGRDPVSEILTVCWCDAHRPACDGADDERVIVSRDYLAANAEADAVTNRPWCELVHRAVRANRLAGSAHSGSRQDDGDQGS